VVFLFSYTHTHTHTHTRARARARTIIIIKIHCAVEKSVSNHIEIKHLHCALRSFVAAFLKADIGIKPTRHRASYCVIDNK